MGKGFLLGVVLAAVIIVGQTAFRHHPTMHDVSAWIGAAVVAVVAIACVVAFGAKDATQRSERVGGGVVAVVMAVVAVFILAYLSSIPGCGTYIPRR